MFWSIFVPMEKSKLTAVIQEKSRQATTPTSPLTTDKKKKTTVAILRVTYERDEIETDNRSTDASSKDFPPSLEVQMHEQFHPATLLLLEEYPWTEEKDGVILQQTFRCFGEQLTDHPHQPSPSFGTLHQKPM
jgi:hypothetical protein